MKSLLLFFIFNIFFSCLALSEVIEDYNGKAYFHVRRPSDYLIPPDNARVEFVIEQFYIEEEFRNRGHGRQLLLLVLNKALQILNEDKNIECVALEAVRGSASFWQHMGFELDNPNEVIRRGEFTDMHLMSIPRNRLVEVIQNIESYGNGHGQDYQRFSRNSHNPCSAILDRSSTLLISAIIFSLFMNYYGVEFPNFFGDSLK